MTIQTKIDIIPEISVIMPVFNGACFLKRAIDSVLSQKFQDWELVAVDDGSEDGSYQLLSQCADSDPRIRPLRLNENRGASAARNLALQHSRGHTIVYLDCDDEYYPHYLGYVYRLHDKGDVLVFAYDAADDDGVFLQSGEVRTWVPAVVRTLLLHRNVACPLGVAHRRALLEKAGFFDESKGILEDWDLWKRFALLGAEFIYLPIRSGLYHIRVDSQSRKRSTCLAEEKQGHRTLGIKNDDMKHTPEAWHTNQRSFCIMTARISLTMIVKNEAATLGRCLASVRDLVDEIIIVDTGSSDNTKDIAGQHGARVFDLPWPDSFAAARNESIRHASGQWILWLDADEHFDDANRDKLRHLLAGLGEDNTAFVLKCVCLPGQAGNSTTNVDHVRLFRNHPAIRWDYRVHEQILPALKRVGHAVCFTDIAIMHTGYTDPALRHKKLERNLRLLHLDMAERPNDPFTLFNLGWSYADLGRIRDAIPLLQRSLQHSHNGDSITPKLYSLLSQCHRRLGQYAQAWSVCQAGQVRCPDDAELLFLKGQLRHERGDRVAARACWMQLLDVRSLTVAAPADGVFTSIDAGLQGPLVRHHLAVLDREEGHLADAEKHWRSILDDTPDFHPARLGLAELYLRQERWPEMETLLTELQPHAPLDTAILQARMNLARQDFAAARQLLADVIQKAPQFLPGHVILSHVLLQSGEERAAEPQLRRIVEMDAGQAESWRNLAVLYRRTQRLREAIAAAKAGCLHCPHDADLLLLQGALLREGGDALNAETCLLRVLEMASGNGPAQRLGKTARQHLIALYRGLGRHREAEAHSRALAAESPELLHNSETRLARNGQMLAGSAN